MDPNRSEKLEWLAIFVGVSIMVQMGMALLVPYIAAYLHIQLNDSDRALIGQAASAVINVLMILVGFLFGTSAGRKQQEDSLNKIANIAAAQAPSPPPDKTIPLNPGETAAVIAEPAKPEKTK